MSTFDDYSNPYTSPVATAAGYGVPQGAGLSSPLGQGSISPQRPPVFYQGAAPAVSPPPSGFGGVGGMVQGIANGFASGISNHPLTLMALGAGIAQGGVGKGLELGTAAAQASAICRLNRSITPTSSTCSPAQACPPRKHWPLSSIRA